MKKTTTGNPVWRDQKLPISSAHEAARIATLTERESQVLDLLMAGGSAAQIARYLSLSLSTVRTHIQSIMFKLGVSSQLAAVAMACRARCTVSESRCRNHQF